MSINCNDCGTPFIQKKSTHRFCSDRCRKRSHRRKKGISILPDFSQFNQKESIAEAVNTHPVATLRREIRRPKIIRRPSRRDFLKSEVIRTRKQKLPLFTILGAVGGYAMGESDASKIGLSIGLGVLGRYIDKANDRERIQTHLIAKKALKRFKRNPAKIEAPKISMDKIKANSSQESIGILSAKDYKDAQIPTIGFTGKYLYLMGDPSHGFYMMVTGAPGNGKSTFSIQFSEYLNSNHGRVLYLAAEQPRLNLPLQNLLKENNVSFDIHTQPPSKLELLNEQIKGYKFVVFDSVNHMNLSSYDLKKLKDSNPLISFVCVMQSTKAGEFKGNQEYLHDCDIRVNLKRPKVYQTKSRFAPPSDMLLFTDKT